MARLAPGGLTDLDGLNLHGSDLDSPSTSPSASDGADSDSGGAGADGVPWPQRGRRARGEIVTSYEARVQVRQACSI